MKLFSRAKREPAEPVICTMPHCDARVLHAPGECKYCDQCPDWQELRVAWGIAFTGHRPVINDKRPWLSEVPCPSEVRRRGVETPAPEVYP